MSQKIVLLVALILISAMIGSVNAAIAENNDQEKIFSGNVTNIRYYFSEYEGQGAFYVTFDTGEWLVLTKFGAYGSVVADYELVWQIKINHNQQLTIDKKNYNWELVRVEEIKGSG
jgi:hypothetical protein